MIVGSIMLQQGKGSDLGSAFGGGSSDSLFGPLGPVSYTHLTLPTTPYV